MPTFVRSGSRAVRVARIALLVVGLALITVAFLGLVHEQLVLANAAPWWYGGLFGIACVLVGLGSPRTTSHDD